MCFVVFSTKRSIKPITYICCSFGTWNTYTTVFVYNIGYGSEAWYT